jgi:magnesium chelatase family protein
VRSKIPAWRFPSNKRITVNLAPADLPKDSGRLDLPIALGILAASGQIDINKLQGFEFAAELSLSGALRPVRGALAMALTLMDAPGPVSLVLPPGSAEEAALVPGVTIYRARHLLDVVRQFLAAGVELADAGDPADTEGWCRMQHSLPSPRVNLPDMADVKGQAGPKRALEIAAAGGHSLLLVGPWLRQVDAGKAIFRPAA